MIRIRWQARHWFWLALTLIVVAGVAGKRACTGREVEPLGRTAPSESVAPQVSIAGWPGLNAFDDGQYRFVRVANGRNAIDGPDESEATGADLGGRLVVRFTDDDGNEHEVALAAVTTAGLDAPGRERARRAATEWFDGRDDVRLLTLQAGAPPLVFVAAAVSGEPDAPGRPYRLLNRDLVAAGHATFASADIGEPIGDAPLAAGVLAMVVREAAQTSADDK